MGKPIRRNGRYSTRRRIPKDLIAAYDGRLELVVALGTADPAEARILHARKWVALDEEFAAKRVELRGSASAEAEATDHAARQALALRAAPFETRQAVAISRLRRSRLKALEKDELEEWTALRRLDLATHQEVLTGREPPIFTMQSHEMGRNALRAVLDGEGAATFAPTVDHLSLPQALPLAALVERWERAKQPTLKTANKARSVILEFEKDMGLGPLSSAQLTPRLIQLYKEHLEGSGAALATGNNKLGLLRTVCEVSKAHLLGGTNPCVGINITVPKKRKAQDRRLAFEVEHLGAIFASPVYMEDLRPLAGASEAAYWLPVLALYTGARQRELGQLRIKDVVQEPYMDGTGSEAEAWVIRIVSDIPDGLRLKNEASERRVPIHAKLIEQGFVRFVEDARASGQYRLFPHLLPDADGNVTAAWSKWFGRWLRSTCGITDRRRVFHSFRHTFKHFARYSLIAPDVQNEITGHETGDTADDYGGLSYPLHPLVEGMTKYRVPGFALPEPPPSFR